jgi:hypothetical protein
VVRHDNVVGHEGPPVQVNLPLQLGVLPLQSADPELPLHGYYGIRYNTKMHYSTARGKKVGGIPL